MKWILPTTAIIAITALEGYALYLGINGVLLAGTAAIIAGLGGFTAGRVTKKNE
ncbi:hypothetical protein ES708_23237 [subsurface metagenome]